MGKYKSYIFLGITLVVLLLVGYCVASTSKNKKNVEKEEVKTVQSTENQDSTVPKTHNVPQEVQQTQTGTSKSVNIIEQPVQESQTTPKTIKIPEINLNFKKNKNQLSWNPELANSGAELTLVIYRYEDGFTDEKEVSNMSSFIYEPGSEGNNLPSRVTLKVSGNINVKGKNVLDEVKFTCKAH